MRWCLPALVAVCVLLLEPLAQACSGNDCEPARVVPSHDTVMPANAAGIRWYSAGADVEQVTLRESETNVELPIAFVEDGWIYDLRPAVPLEPDKSYRFELPASDCSDAFQYWFVSASPVEIAANNLGSLTATPTELDQIEVPESVSCSIYVDAVSVRINLELDPQLQPFADLLMYETLVDGEPWHHTPRFFAPLQIGRSWIGRGVDLVFATCPGGGSDGVSLGPHEVQMLARIPGLPDVLLASNVVEITLECATTAETGDDGESDHGESDDESDSGESGNFVVPHDPAAEDDRGGCSCSSDGERSTAVLTAPLVLLLAWSRRRRRPC